MAEQLRSSDTLKVTLVRQGARGFFSYRFFDSKVKVQEQVKWRHCRCPH